MASPITRRVRRHMTPERWATVEKLYHAALGKGPAERGPFLAEMCAGDDALRREVESLLEHDGSAAFLGPPAVAPVGRLMPSGSSFIGQAVGPSLISRPTGSGRHSGEVYRARDQKLGRDIAIKILPPPPARPMRNAWLGLRVKRACSRRSTIRTSAQ